MNLGRLYIRNMIMPKRNSEASLRADLERMAKSCLGKRKVRQNTRLFKRWLAWNTHQEKKLSIATNESTRKAWQTRR